ncbi:ATP-binding protein [Phenylobacterium sp.]|uniref:ATP-binding protein n=1 Tax=Phenylobacterium sp. TaxID=1871053 RepID=UPI0025E8957D|nr:ATP-binding protein [Phenylobacterium sp.]
MQARDPSAGDRPSAGGTSATTAWMESVWAALEDVRRSAEDMLPGASARLVAPLRSDPLVTLALDADAPQDLAVGDRYAAAVPIRLEDDAVAAVLVVSFAARPQVEVLERLARLARLARFSPAAPDETAARRAALVSVVRSIPLRVLFTDCELRVLAASPVSAAEMGVPEAEFIGRSLAELRPEVFGRFRKVLDRALAGETIRTPRFRSQIGDGPVHWFQTEVHPWRDVNGRVAGIIMVAVDITETVEAIRGVELSEQRLKIALELADLHVWELDYATQALTTGGATSTFFDGSLSDAEIVADAQITIHPDDRARIGPAWEEAVLNDTPFRPEYRINRADGKEVWAACATRMIRDAAGEPLRLIGAMQNITDRKQSEAEIVRALEQAEAANRAKSVFLATMSHEIRTPLNGVLGMAQAMAADDLTGPQRSRLRTIRQSGEALLVILNDLLDLSKIEAGKLELELADFALTPLLESVQAAFGDLAASKGLALTVEAGADAPGVYRGDATRLRQILFNLVSNSLKFTERGEVRVEARGEGEALVFSVTDTGIGIPADRLARLFDKFEQADASTTRRFGGTGLGLAISRDLAAMMQGVIAVASREGEGSQFHLSVTLARVGDEAPADCAEAAPETAGFQAETPLRVLAAEDNSINQLVLRTLLQQMGVEPVIVDDGAAAVAAWRGQAWDLILMDVQMPVMDGPTATRTIRALEAETGRARTPIVAVTANAMAHQVAEYTADGMDGVIAKPIRVEALFGALQAVLDEAEISQAA